MILKIPSIEADGSVVMADTKLNIQILRRQCRLISTITTSTKTTPIDLVIGRWGDPSLGRLSVLAIQINGEEQQSKKKFDCKIGFDFMKKKWLVDGTIGVARVNESLNQFGDFIHIIQKYF